MQRASTAMALMFLVSVLMPGGHAQEDSAVELLVDPEGDVSVAVADSTVPVPGRFGAFDLVALRAIETPDDVVFELKVRDLASGPEIVYAESSAYRVAFEHNGRILGVYMARWVDVAGSGTWGNLQSYDPQEDSWTWQSAVDVEQDAEANMVRATVPRALLYDQDGARPYPGRTLEAFWAVGMHSEINREAIGSLAGPSGFIDRMPDAGTGGVEMPFEHGLSQTGGITLSSQQPFRMSNGAATTFVFHVDAHNDGDAAQRLRLRASGAPDGWTVRFPEPSVSLAAGETRQVPVLATMPFAHEHGSQRSFVVAAANDDGTAVGRIELGVLYTPIPQPSGHHSRLWLHAAPTSGGIIQDALRPLPADAEYVIMNADPEWEGAAARAVQSSHGYVNPEERWQWQAYLWPLLGMGLDFDLEREALLTVPISVETPMEGVEAEVYFYHWATDDRKTYDGLTLASATVPIGDLQAGQTEILEIPFPISDDADTIGVRKDQGLYLRFTLVAPGLGPNAVAEPYLQPGGTLDLPLFEYHDPLEALEGSFGLSVEVDGPAERLANPGAVVMFDAVVQNHDPERRLVALGIQGNAADWVTLGASDIEVPATSSARVPFQVRVPQGVPDGELADLVLEAVADDGTSALQRIWVIVDTDAEHADDAALQTGEVEEAPVLTPWLFLVVLVAAATRRRPQP